MLYFVTSNKDKIFLATSNLSPLGIEFETKPFDAPEIQSDNTDEIAIKKAIDAYSIIQQPLFVSDDTWSIPALNGFPGAYMHYINEWLTPEDILRLMQPYTNREAILRQTLCFTDGTQTKVFSQDNTGSILDKPQGKGQPSLVLTTFTKSGKSLAECFAEKIQPVENVQIWKDFAQWYLSLGETE